MENDRSFKNLPMEEVFKIIENGRMGEVEALKRLGIQLDVQKINCPKCKKTLFYAKSADLEIKCPRCGALIHIEINAKSVKHTVIRE